MFDFTQSRANKVAKKIATGDYDVALHMLRTAKEPLGNGVYKGVTSLMRAIYIEYIEIIELLLEQGADLHARDHNDDTCLEYLSLNQGALPVIDALMKGGFSIETPFGVGKSLLLKAVEERGQLGLIKGLVERGADIGANVLHMTIYKLNTKALEVFLDAGADINTRTYNNWTMLHLAAARNDAECVKFLLERGADATLKDKEDKTAWELVPDQESELCMKLREVVGLPRLRPMPIDWKLTGEFEIALTTDKKQLGYRLTEVFNFHRQTYMVIAQNTSTRAESLSVKSFAEIDNPSLISEAGQIFIQLGGALPDSLNASKGGVIVKSLGGPDV